MVGHDPHRVVLVFYHRTDTRTDESAGHVEQIDASALLVIDAGSRCRALPYQAARVFHHTYRRRRIHRHIGVFGDDAVGQLPRHGIHVAVVPAGTYYQPSFLDPSDRGHVVAGQFRILLIPCPERVLLQVKHLYSTAKRTYPDASPLVFRHAPHVIGRQAFWVVRSAIVHDFRPLDISRGDATHQSAIIRAKPDAAVMCTMAAHHDVTRQLTVGRREVGHLLIRFRIIHDDTVVIAAYPIVAALVLADGVDIAHLQAADTGQSLHILVDTVLIRSYPDITVTVLIDITQRVVTHRRLVQLVVQELLPLLMLQVDYKQSQMVGSYPYPAAIVGHHIPYLHVVGQPRQTLAPEVFRHRLIPALLLLSIDERIALG